MVKPYLLSILFLLSTNLFGQIKIAPVDFFWVNRVDSALNIIKNTDKSVYDTLIRYCTNIGFWNGKFSTIEEVVRVYDRTINDYVTHDTLTATIEIATLTNGKVTIQCQDNQFVSNIYKDRRSRWNRNPKPTISSYTSGRSYTSLKKCVAVAEELMEELVAAAQSAASKKNVMQQAVEALQSRYTDATIAITTEWDRTNWRDRERVRVQLSNGVSMMVDPWMNAEGVLSYAVGTVNFGDLKGVDIITALNGIAI